MGQLGTFDRIITLNQLLDIRNLATADNLSIACATGCFDILHPGHVRFLERAKESADILIVGVVHDEAYRPLKGREPVLNEADRIYVVSRLACVDHVVPFGAEDELILGLVPDIVVISPTSPPERIADKQRLAQTIGGRAYIIEEQSSVHSTGLIQRLRAS